ncbi:MAG: hypothetical protein WA428_08445 [Candidatus Cybelea sp.]
MNRLVTLLALAIGVSGPASAGIINPYGNPELNTNVVAGQVGSTGVVERGSGFRVHIFGLFYKIKFDRRYFPSGCAALVASPTTEPLVPIVTQNQCGDVFTVSLYDASTGKLAYGEFQFIAREDAPQHP